MPHRPDPHQAWSQSGMRVKGAGTRIPASFVRNISHPWRTAVATCNASGVFMAGSFHAYFQYLSTIPFQSTLPYLTETASLAFQANRRILRADVRYMLDSTIRKGFDWRRRLFDSVPKTRTPGEDLPDLVSGIGVDGAIAEPVGPVRLLMGSK